MVSEPALNEAMSKILELVSDGKPHPITELRDIQLPTAELDAALDYLLKEELIRQEDGSIFG
jgi:ATP-dependent DNA helicase RecQ